MASWQANLTSSQKRLSHIFATGDASDVTFIVEKPPSIRKTFKLHKVILSTCSDAFFDMFYDSKQKVDELKVLDIHPSVFEKVMKYVYEDFFSSESVHQATLIYRAAEAYNIVHLKYLCVASILHGMTSQTVPILYKVPSLLQSMEIKTKCRAILSEETLNILTNSEFVNSPFSMVKEMLQLDNLNVESEEELFEYVLKWAKSFLCRNGIACTKETVRKVMDDFLPQIRFLTMGVKGFLLGPGRSDILTDSEIASISSNLVTSGCRKLPSWCNTRESRKAMQKFQLIKLHTCQFTGTLFNTIKCTFSMKKGDVSFRGVSVYVSPDRYTSDTSGVSLSIKNQSKTFLSGSNLSYDSKTCLLKCTLFRPFKLTLSADYEISLKSQIYIFQQCSIWLPDFFTRIQENFEIKCNIANGDHCASIHNGCLHFHEIFFS